MRSNHQVQTSEVRKISIFQSAEVARVARQAVAGGLLLTFAVMSSGAALAQNYPPPPPQNYPQNGAPGYGEAPPEYGNAGYSGYQPLAPEQLDSLVAPIALYPDSLVAQVLAASTYPAQVASAEQFVEQSGNYPPAQLAEVANGQPWDPSVKSLVAFPQVLNDLNRNMDWTTQLGNAYYNQPQDVLSAVQVMRQRAYAAGTLRTTPQLAVTYEPGDILIAPVSPTVVYVPYYDPWVVYGAPVPVYAHYYYGPPRGVGFGTGLAIGFGAGIAVAAFTHFAWGYHSWHPDWGGRNIVYNHNTYISRSVTVVNHGNYGRYDGHYDQGVRARAFDRGYARGADTHYVNNVPVNRGGGFENRGTYNRSPQGFHSGSGTYNQGPGGFHSEGGTYNRGPQTYNGGGATSNRAPQYNNRPGTPGGGNQQFHPYTPAAPARQQGGFDHGGQYNQARQQQPTPQQHYQAPQQAPQQPRYQAPQQRSAPEAHGGGGHENQGGGHQDHVGGGHEDHHH